jgi:hypothetical protein
VGQVLTFDYCTQSVPDDLADATASGSSPAGSAPRGATRPWCPRHARIGSERFWFGNAPGQTGPFPPDIQAMLDNYDVPVVA